MSMNLSYFNKSIILTENRSCILAVIYVIKWALFDFLFEEVFKKINFVFNLEIDVFKKIIRHSCTQQYQDII